MGKMLNFLTGKPSKAQKLEEVEEERLQHARNTAEFLSGPNILSSSNQHARHTPSERQAANDEALRRLNGRPDPPHRRPQRARADETPHNQRMRPEPAHFRRQRVRTDYSDFLETDGFQGYDHHRSPWDRFNFTTQALQVGQDSESGTETSALPQYIAPSFGGSGESSSSHLQSLHSRDGGNPDLIRGPDGQVGFTFKDGNSHGSVHGSEVLSRASTRRTNQSMNVRDRHTRFSDFMERPVSPISPTPPVPSLPRIPKPAGTQRRREGLDRNNRPPFCQMCEHRPSSMSAQFSALGYHLCTECRRRAFGPDLESPVSPPTPTRGSEARLQDFDFADQYAGRDVSDGLKNKSPSRHDSRSGNITGQVAHRRENTVRRVFTEPSTRARQQLHQPPSTIFDRPPSSGLSPALHKRPSHSERRIQRYSTIFNDRSQAQPAPSFPLLLPQNLVTEPPRQHTYSTIFNERSQAQQPSPPPPLLARPALPQPQSSRRDKSPERHQLRNKSSSVYSLPASLPPGTLPPSTIPTIGEEATLTLPGTSYSPPKHPLREREEAKPFPRRKKAARGTEVEMMPNHHRNTSRRPRPEEQPPLSPQRQRIKKMRDGLRVSPPDSPKPSVRSIWTTDWSGYPESVVKEALGTRTPVPPMPTGRFEGERPPLPPIPTVEDEKESPRRDTRFYGFYDDVLKYGSKGPGGARRYNQL